jgi:hypothetical protein
MISKTVERRSEFRFPFVVPVEYFKPGDSGILGYALDLSNNGTFISSNDPLNVGSRFGMDLNIPIDKDKESSRIVRTEGTVAWKTMQNHRNGMGVQFIKPLPETILFEALANNVKTLMRENEEKKALGVRVENLESELEGIKRLATLGRNTEKILIDLSNPILALSGRLETIKYKMYKHKGMLEDHKKTNREEAEQIAIEFDNCCDEVDKILKDYKVISELIHMAGNDKETLERKLK